MIAVTGFAGSVIFSRSNPLMVAENGAYEPTAGRPRQRGTSSSIQDGRTDPPVARRKAICRAGVRGRRRFGSIGGSLVLVFRGHRCRACSYRCAASDADRGGSDTVGFTGTGAFLPSASGTFNQ